MCLETHELGEAPKSIFLSLPPAVQDTVCLGYILTNISLNVYVAVTWSRTNICNPVYVPRNGILLDISVCSLLF